MRQKDKLMNKCNLATDCKGHGTCCFYCPSYKNCNTVCDMVNKKEIHIEKDVQNCYWLE